MSARALIMNNDRPPHAHAPINKEAIYFSRPNSTVGLWPNSTVDLLTATTEASKVMSYTLSETRYLSPSARHLYSTQCRSSTHARVGPGGVCNCAWDTAYIFGAMDEEKQSHAILIMLHHLIDYFFVLAILYAHSIYHPYAIIIIYCARHTLPTLRIYT